MDSEPVKRRLTTIFSTDVQGYSRLMADDEAATIHTLKTYREIISSHIERHGGRVVDSPGDNLLAEFGSVVHAVESAVEIQQALKERNNSLPEDRKMRFRIGINVGDVVVDGDRLYGDGVNIAARLESLAEGGGICLSGGVHDQVHNKLPLGFEDLGEQDVKNIPKPVRVYALRGETIKEPTPESVTNEPLPLPDKPSIAVLPFENMSGDPEQEYFADGIAEDIITALSRFHWFFVIARNSSFTYKGDAVDVQKVARELGVQYVLEGSVRKAGNRVRITAQLIDAITGHHVWVERYDRDLQDIFAVQDEITESIAGAVAPSFVSAEARRLERKAPESFDAWDYAIRGNWHLWRIDKENLSEARRNFEAAVDLDPENCMALSGLALACSWEVVWGFAEDPEETRNLEFRMARQAVATNELDAWAHYALGQVYLHRRQLEEAERAIRRALELNPNLAVAQGVLSNTYAWMGHYDAAIENVEKAARLNPKDPSHAWFPLTRVVAAFVVGRYEEQVEWAQKMIEAAPTHPAGWRFLAAGYGLLGRQPQAHAAVEGLLRLVPHFTIELTRTASPGVREEDLERLLDGLRKAGVPE